MEFLNRQVESSASIYNDLHSLDRIRQQAKSGNQAKAIKAAAKEFEAFFMNMMLKSMRQASEVIGEDSMFSSQQEKMFIGMLDEQMSVDLSQKGNLGIAELLTRDLLGENMPINSSSNISDYLARARKTDMKSESIEQDLNNRHSMLDDIIPSNADNSYASQTGITGINQSNYLANISLAKATTRFSDNLSSLNTKSEIMTDAPAQKKALFESAENFISQLLPTAEKVSQNLGVDPKLLLAQAALETGWGKYIMHDPAGKPSYNLFGIKGNNDWQGDSVKADTLEVEQGTFVKRQQEFRMYENFEQSFQDYVDFVKSNPRYQQAVDAVENAKDYIRSLQDSGYATDPNYAEKIINIYENGINPSSVLK